MPITVHQSKSLARLILLSMTLPGCASYPPAYPTYSDPYRPVYSPTYTRVLVDPYPTTYSRSYPNYVYARRIIARDQHRSNYNKHSPSYRHQSNRHSCPNPAVKDGKAINCRN